MTTPDATPRARSVLARMRLDTGPLRSSRDFRLLFAGGSVSYVGSMVTYVALPFQIADLTGSYLAVGLVSAVELVPLVVFGLYGGALADAVDRRRLVLATEVLFTLVSGALLGNALLPDPQLWVIYAASFLFAVLDGLQRPSLDALVPRIVEPHDLAAAGALSTLRMNTAMIAGPALGGLVIAAWGVPAAFGIDVVSYAFSLVALMLMRASPAPPDSARPSLRGLAEAGRYALRRRDLLGTYLVDLAAMIFAFPYVLFPFVAEEMGSPWALGLLYAAPYVGSLLVTVTSGWTSHVHRHGRAVVVGALVWGVGVAGFGLSSTLPLALAFLALAGAGDMVSGLFRGLIWNLTIPDTMRGRMAGIELLSYSIGPVLGGVRASVAARVTSLRASIVSGGVAAVIATAALAVALPSLWRFDDRTDENALLARAERAARARD